MEKEIRYNLNKSGKVAEIGENDNYEFLADGTEPWFNNLEDAQKWEFVGGSWNLWYDELSSLFPEKTISQVISSPLSFPNVVRTLHVGRMDFDIWADQIKFELFIRHTRPDGRPILKYDEIIKFRLTNGTELKDPITGQNTGAYTLFYLRMIRDGIEFTDNVKQLILFMDGKNIINEMITKY